MQQRQPKSFCQQSDYIDCNYNYDPNQLIFASKPNDTQCVLPACGEYTYRNNIDYTENSTIWDLQFNGKYSLYNALGYFINLNFQNNLTEAFLKLKQNKWIDEQTQVIIALASLYDFKSNRQVQILFQAEMPFDLQILYQSVQMNQLSVIEINDSFQSFLFFYFLAVVIMISFRGLLELAYLFSKFTLPLLQIVYYSALYVFTVVHLYRMFKSAANDGKTLLFTKDLMKNQLGVEIFGPQTFYQNLDFVIIENSALLFLWIIYPFRLLKLYTQLFTNTWYRSYLNAVFRTVPSLNIMGLLIFFLYGCGFMPVILLNESNRISNQQNSLLIFLSRPFTEQQNELIYGNQISYYNCFFDFICTLLYTIILSYLYSIIAEAFRKSAIMELPYTSRSEKDMDEIISDINVRTTKFLKEIIKILPKDKKNSQSRGRQVYESNLLDDDVLSIQMNVKSSVKILLVYEIHNSYLDEINRYQERKNHRRSNAPVKPKNKVKKVGTIIAQLLQKSQNTRLQNMLSKYQTQDGYVKINETNEDREALDFLKTHQQQIEEQGITIRTFYILDQINKFLQMLVKLRPEFLSPNAEQRIRIFFFINSQEVSEDDVYKLLSFLIVNLKNNHLTYPILIFSHHKVDLILQNQDWYIEKEKYLTLKKVYKNIYSTLDEKCALSFSLMETSLLDLQTKYAQEQEFQETKELQNQTTQDINSFDDDNLGKSDYE